MRLREREMDPDARRELEAVDAALRGDRVDPDLAALTTELRRERPSIDRSFAAKLDERVARGLSGNGSGDPSGEGATLLERATGLLRGGMRPALATAAAVLLALTVTFAVMQDDDGRDPGEAIEGVSTGEEPGVGAPEAPDSAVPQTAQGTREPAPMTVPPVPIPPGEPLRPGKERVQERSASLTLSTDAGEVQRVADGVVEVTDRHDGIVVSSQVSTSGEAGRATFDLRIPTRNLQAAMADLSGLASVASRNEGSLDITGPFIGAEERFADARAEVDALLEELEEAESASEISSIRQQLRIARGELASARSALASLKQRADFSRLSVAVTSGGDADGWSLGDAVDDAVSVLEDMAGAALVSLAVILPLGLLVLIAGFALRGYRRYTRERALSD